MEHLKHLTFFCLLLGGGEYVPRPNLSTIEIESLMKEKVYGKFDSLKQVCGYLFYNFCNCSVVNLNRC